MPKTYTITECQGKEAAHAREKIKDKRIDKRLHAIQLRGEGYKNPAIAAKLDTVPKVVSRWVSAYCNGGIDALLIKQSNGRPRQISHEEESAFLENYKKQAEQGQIIEVSAIKAAYEEKVGHCIGGSQIYYVLKRHGWRKVMPRSKHPNKASEAEIEASKKLTAESEN